MTRTKRPSRSDLAVKLAQQGFIKSARALIAREPAGVLIVIEVNQTEAK